MEASVGLIYLLNVLDDLKDMLIVMSVIGIFIVAVVTMYRAEDYEYSITEFFDSKLYRKAKKILIILLIILLTTVFIPDKTAMLTMFVIHPH